MSIKIFTSLLATFFILLFQMSSVQAATLTALSAQETVVKGDTVVVEWFLDTEGQMVNVIDASITYSPQTLEVVSLSTANSAATLWTMQPSITGPGVISFMAGIPAGVSGTRVPILRATVRAISVGDAAFSIQNNAQALLSDGVGTKVPLLSTPVVFAVQNASISRNSITSPTHPDQEKWHHDRRVVITFSTKPGEQYSYSMSTNPEVIPDQVADDAGAAVIYDALPDGVYYFKLASRVGAGVWQESGVFRVQLDDTAPTVLSNTVSTSADLYANAPFASFTATDKISGVISYKIKSGWFDWYRDASNPEKLRRPLVGDTFLKVRDVAGNVTVVKIDFNSILPPWAGYFGILVVLVVLFFVIRFLKRHLVFTPHESSV